MGRCEKEEVGEDIITTVWRLRGRQKRWKIANDVPVGKQTPAAADHSKIPERKLKIRDLSHTDTGGQYVQSYDWPRNLSWSGLLQMFGGCIHLSFFFFLQVKWFYSSSAPVFRITCPSVTLQPLCRDLDNKKSNRHLMATAAFVWVLLGCRWTLSDCQDFTIFVCYGKSYPSQLVVLRIAEIFLWEIQCYT